MQARKRGALVNQFEAPAQELYWNSIASVLYEAIIAAGSVVYKIVTWIQNRFKWSTNGAPTSSQRGSSWNISVSFHADILLQRVGEPGDGWGWAEWDDG